MDRWDDLFVSCAVPVLKREPFASQKTLLFRLSPAGSGRVVWGAIAVLLLTGPLLLHQRGIPIADPSGWPMVLVVKLGLVATLLLLTVPTIYHRASRRAGSTKLPHESRNQVRVSHDQGQILLNAHDQSLFVQELYNS